MKSKKKKPINGGTCKLQEKLQKSVSPMNKNDYCICAGEYGACANRVNCDFANGFLGIEKGPFEFE